MRNTEKLPKHIVLSNKVYNLDISFLENSERAFIRVLVDYRVAGYNSQSRSDSWHTLLGVSEELYSDYPSYKIEIPLEWILFRFLAHFVRTNSVKLLNGMGGEVLKTTSFKNYLGNITNEEKAKDILKIIFSSWISSFPDEPIKLVDIFVSTDISFDIINRVLNSMIFNNHIEEVDDTKSYKINPILFAQSTKLESSTSLDRISNRYYQEILIQANEPFCFVLMPFKETEFDQSIYFDVIKPLIESEFKISCYRVDEDGLPDRIDNKIYTYILKASFIVTEVSTRNPNVMYELGLAHMLEKDCIILTQNPNAEVPFDIQRISAEPYMNKEQLQNYLRKSISALAFKLKR